MPQLKTATGTFEISDANIALLMKDSPEKSKIEMILSQCGLNVHSFSNAGAYAAAARDIPFSATLAQGATSAEVGVILGLIPNQVGKYCLVNSSHALIELLSLQSMVGYCLEKGYSNEDLIRTVHQMLRKP